MKISNNKNVPLINKNTQNTNQFVTFLSPKNQKTTSQNLIKNIQNLPAPTSNIFNQGSDKNIKTQPFHKVVNNQRVINNQQSPRKFELIKNNIFLKNHETNINKKISRQPTNIKKEKNFQNQYHSVPYSNQIANCYATNNVHLNPNSLPIRFPQQGKKNTYITNSDRNGFHGQLSINRMPIMGTNNFIGKIPPQKNIYTQQQKVFQKNAIQTQKSSKQYSKTINLNNQTQLLKSKSSHNLNVPNIYTFQKSQSNQSQHSQNFSKESKGKLNLKKVKSDQNQGYKIFQETNPSKEYYNRHDNLLSPLISQKQNKKHNFLRLSKSLQHNQHHRQKLHLHTSRFGNKVNFDSMYDEEDFGSKNDVMSEQSNGFESLGGSEKQRKVLTSMQSELKRTKRKKNDISSNPKIESKQYENGTNFNMRQNHPQSLQVQPILKVRSNQNMNAPKRIQYKDDYMTQTGNIVQNHQLKLNYNPIVNNTMGKQIYPNQVPFSSQKIQTIDPKSVVNFQVKNQMKPTQQVKSLYHPQNFSINPPPHIAYYHHQSQQKNQSMLRPKSSMPQFGAFVNHQIVKNQKNVQNQGVSKLLLDLNSNITKQKTLIVQPSINQRPQSNTIQNQKYQDINVPDYPEQSALKLRHSPSFGANNGCPNSFLNLNSTLKSKQSLNKHLQQDHLLPQKKQSANSLSSIINNEIGLRVAQVQNTETIDNLSKFHIAKDNTNKTLLSKAPSHGLSDLIMGIKPMNIGNNSPNAKQKRDASEIGRELQKTSSHDLSDLIMGIKPLNLNRKNHEQQQNYQKNSKLGQKHKNLVKKANSNQSLNFQIGFNQNVGLDDCLPLDSKPSSPQLAFGTITPEAERDLLKNKVSPKNSLSDDYLNNNSNITTLQKLTYNLHQQHQNQQKSKIDKKPSFTSQCSFSNLRINSKSKIINNFNINNKQSGSNLKSISQMQSQWQKQSSFQQKSQNNFAQFQQPQGQNMIQNFQKIMNDQKFINFQSIQVGNPNNGRKTNCMNEDFTCLDKIQSDINQETGLFNTPSGLLKQSIQNKLSLNKQILTKQESGFGQQLLKLNTKIVQSKSIPIIQQALNSGKVVEKSAPPQQWLNINREKYSTSQYLNMEQMKKRLQNVQTNVKNVYHQNKQDKFSSNEQTKSNYKELSKLETIQKQNNDFRQKVNSISQTLLSMSPISISEHKQSPNQNSYKLNPMSINSKNNIIQKIIDAPLQRQNVKQSQSLQKNQNSGYQKFQKTASYFISHDNNNSFESHIQYEYSQDGSYGNFNKQNKKSSFFLHQNSDYSQNQDLSDTKKITYTYGHTAKKKSHSKMKSRKSSKLSSSISQSSLNSVGSENKKSTNLYTKKQSKDNDKRKKSNIKNNMNSQSEIKNKEKNSNIMFSNSVFSSQQQNYHKLPKPSIYQNQQNELQVSVHKNIQHSLKNGNVKQNKITYTPVQSQQILQLSSVNSLSFNFVGTNNQPSRNSLKPNSIIGSSKFVDSSKLFVKQSDKMQDDKSKVQKYLINQKLNESSNLYKPIPSTKNKSKDKRTQSVLHIKDGKSQNMVQLVQQGQRMQRNEYSPAKNILQTSQYGISQDSVNYVKIDRHNSLRHSPSQIYKKQIQQKYENNDDNQQQISAILNQNCLPESKYYESRYEIHPSSGQVRYVDSPSLNDDSMYGKDSKVIQTMQFNPVHYEQKMN